ncbi:MAG: GrpB family protein [Candidatus Lokiarchaeota archaeon]|nr:GrpB family protein [Candidatus Lokiarchaeota archaeon]
MTDFGLESGAVLLVHFNLKWKSMFDKESQRLKSILNEFILNIQHIGSTAIPNILVKSIIDIAIAIKPKFLKEISAIVKIMEYNGYIYRGEIGIIDRHLFVKGTRNFRTHHIHLIPITHPQWTKHQLFRDYLIDHPETAKRYEKLKISQKNQFAMNQEVYTEGKSQFIQNIIAKATSIEDK